MKCNVYAGTSRRGAVLVLAADRDSKAVPSTVRESFGQLQQLCRDEISDQDPRVSTLRSRLAQDGYSVVEVGFDV